MKSIKILMVGSDTTVKGGISSVVKQLLKHKWSENIKINYISTHIDDKAVNKVIYFLKSVILLVNNIIAENPDILHIHMSHSGSFYRKYIIFKITKLFDKKVIIHLHGSEFEKFFNKSNIISKLLIRDMLNKSDKFLVLGDNWNTIIKRINSNTNIEILLNTIDIPKEVVKYKDNSVNILFLGSLVIRKGIFELVEVMKNLKNKGILDKYNIRFIIGGTGRDEYNFKQKINEYKLNKYVNLVGWIEGLEKKELLKNSQIFILPSHNEGLPIAILEAISYGLPVISTKVGSIDEAVINNYNGLLVEPCNINQLEEALFSLVGSKSNWYKFSENSKHIAKSKFNEKHYFNKIEQIYNSMSMNIKE